MAFRYRVRRSSRRTRAISGTRVVRTGVRKEYPKFRLQYGPTRREVHFFPGGGATENFLVFSNEVAPPYRQLSSIGVGLAASGSSAYSSLLLNAINQGTAINQREGTSVMVHSILIRGIVSYRGYIQGQGNINVNAGMGLNMELLVVYDREPDQHATTVPALAELLEAAVGPFTSPMNPDTRDRFDVLLRRKISVPIMTTSTSYMPARWPAVDLKIPVNRVTTFKSQTPVVSAPSHIRKGALYLYCLSDYGNTSADAPVFRGFIKLAFTEIQ